MQSADDAEAQEERDAIQAESDASTRQTQSLVAHRKAEGRGGAAKTAAENQGRPALALTAPTTSMSTLPPPLSRSEKLSRALKNAAANKPLRDVLTKLVVRKAMREATGQTDLTQPFDPTKPIIKD